MKVAPYLLRLMHRFPLSRGLRIGPEDRLGIEIADACRAWTLEGRLQAVWWHSANEAGGAKAQARMALAKALGLIAGVPDLVFIGKAIVLDVPAPDYQAVLLMELKAPRGVMSPNQKDFRDWAADTGVQYRVIKSLDEAQAALVEAGILIPKGARP